MLCEGYIHTSQQVLFCKVQYRCDHSRIPEQKAKEIYYTRSQIENYLTDQHVFYIACDGPRYCNQQLTMHKCVANNSADVNCGMIATRISNILTLSSSSKSSIALVPLKVTSTFTSSLSLHLCPPPPPQCTITNAIKSASRVGVHGITRNNLKVNASTPMCAGMVAGPKPDGSVCN